MGIPRAGGLVPEDSKCFCKALVQRFNRVLSSDFIGFLHAGGILAHPARGQGSARRDDEGAQAVLKLLELSEAGIIYGMAAVQRLHQPGITPQHPVVGGAHPHRALPVAARLGQDGDDLIAAIIKRFLHGDRIRHATVHAGDTIDLHRLGNDRNGSRCTEQIAVMRQVFLAKIQGPSILARGDPGVEFNRGALNRIVVKNV